MTSLTHNIETLLVYPRLPGVEALNAGWNATSRLQLLNSTENWATLTLGLACFPLGSIVEKNLQHNNSNFAY